jgi:hypothetical protein
MRKTIIIASVFLLAAACSKQATISSGQNNKILVTNPISNQQLEIGQTYSVKWQGGSDLVSLYLIDKSLESQGASVSKADKIDNIKNTGSFNYQIPNDPSGDYEICIGDRDQTGCSGYFTINKPVTSTPEQASTTPLSLPIKYNNTQYGFIFSLPADWKGYSIYSKQWVGDPLAGSKYTSQTIQGPEIYIRNPNWTEQNQYEDIPVMVLTPDEWKEVQNSTLAVSAAPIDPTELGSNKNYVFVLPPRFDWDFRTGFEEVEKIMQSNPLKAY